MTKKKFTLGEIAEIRDSVQTFIRSGFMVGTSWKLIGFADGVKRAFKRIDEFRDMILAKHGTMNPDGQSYTLTPEAVAAFNVELKEALALTVEIETPTITSTEMLCEHLPLEKRPVISADVLAALHFLFPEYTPASDGGDSPTEPTVN